MILPSDHKDAIAFMEHVLGGEIPAYQRRILEALMRDEEFKVLIPYRHPGKAITREAMIKAKQATKKDANTERCDYKFPPHGHGEQTCMRPKGHEGPHHCGYYAQKAKQ